MKTFFRKCQMSPICMSPCVIVIELEVCALSQDTACLLPPRLDFKMHGASFINAVGFLASEQAHLCLHPGSETSSRRGMALNKIKHELLKGK